MTSACNAVPKLHFLRATGALGPGAQPLHHSRVERGEISPTLPLNVAGEYDLKGRQKGWERLGVPRGQVEPIRSLILTSVITIALSECAKHFRCIAAMLSLQQPCKVSFIIPISQLGKTEAEKIA